MQMKGTSDRLDFELSNKERGKLITGVMGNVILLLQFIVHFPEVWMVYQTRSGLTYSVLPHILLLSTYCLWGMYASPPINPHPTGGLPLLTASCLGIVTQSTFLWMFWKSEPNIYDKITLQKYLITGSLFCVTLLASSILPGEFELLAVGYICMIWTTSVFFAPLIRKVIKLLMDGFRMGDSQEYPQLGGHVCRLLFVILNTIHSGVWTFYGMYAIDLFIVVPYALGVACGLIELSAILFYTRATQPVPVDVESFHEITEVAEPHSHIDKGNEKSESFRDFLQVKSPPSSPPPPPPQQQQQQKAEGDVSPEIQEEEEDVVLRKRKSFKRIV